MKTLAEQTEKESEKTVLSAVEVAIGEGTPVVTENVSAKGEVKKKVRIVKKIVKKKVVKKVPKRVSVASSGNDLGKVEVSNPNDNVLVSLEIEKPNVVDDDLRKVENMEEFEISVGADSCRHGCKSGLVTAALLEDRKRTDRKEKRHDNNNANVEEHECEVGLNEQVEKSANMDVGVSNGTKSYESVKVLSEKSECVVGAMDIELPNDVEGEKKEEEQVEKRECVDSKLSNDVEGQEVVKKLAEKSEIRGLRVDQGSGDRIVLGGEMEALERKRRTTTEIIIRGLDKETKEEDLRKPFEEVGEVVEVRLVVNRKTGKCRGFGFIRYASATDAESAMTKYHNIEICGRQCHTAAVEGSDTIFLCNIDKKWNREYILALLQETGIEKIEKVSVAADSESNELNRGFAILEFETRKDAQMAYRKLQKKDVFGRHSKLKVSWAEPLVEPDAEEIQNIKSVYAEHIPSSWDEEEVKDYFKIFGEIESIGLAKNLRPTKRKDFAFINFKSREAALACLETLTSEQSTTGDGLKAGPTVSLAKSIQKSKRIKPFSASAITEFTQPAMIKQKAKRAVFKSHKRRNVRISSTRKHEDARTDRGSSKRRNVRISSIRQNEDARMDTGSSTTVELVQLLREQATWKLAGPSSTTGASTGHHHPSPGVKRPFPDLGTESLYHDPRAYHQAHLESHNIIHPRSASNGLVMTSFPHYNQQRDDYTSGLFNRVEANPRYFQTREQAHYHGSSSVYRHTHY